MKDINTIIARTVLLLFLSVAALHAEDCWQERATGPGGPAGTSIWTGSEMIVWGGWFATQIDTGARYQPATNSWTAVTTTGAPAARSDHTAVWTGSEMIVWGGYNGSYLNTGGRYNPATNTWTAVTTTGAPAGRGHHTAVWTGSELIVWGGHGGLSLNTGGRYNPATDSWTAVTTTGAPAARSRHTAVWTGSEMIIWGGATQGSILNTGVRYNPAANSWTAVSTTGMPGARYRHTAVWTGSEMIVWGGHLDFLGSVSTNSGARYNPAANSWTTVSTTRAPAARQSHTAVWTGSEMIVWGGRSERDDTATRRSFNDGARYNPAGNYWTAMITIGAPTARAFHTALWTGGEMIVWGGATFVGGSDSKGTFSYIPDCETFRITSAVLNSGHLVISFPTVTGRIYTLWRSETMAEGTWTDTGLPAVVGTGATLSFTVPASGPDHRFFRAQVNP